MILAIEGPDCSGKTTLFKALKWMPSYVFVPSLPFDSELKPVMHIVEKRQAAVWKYLYNKRVSYICDRHFSVSSVVYDILYNRPVFDASEWEPEVRVIYLSVPLEELQKRYSIRGDKHFKADRYEKCLEIYKDVLKGFRHTVIDGTKLLGTIVYEAREFIHQEESHARSGIQ